MATRHAGNSCGPRISELIGRRSADPPERDDVRRSGRNRHDHAAAGDGTPRYERRTRSAAHRNGPPGRRERGSRNPDRRRHCRTGAVTRVRERRESAPGPWCVASARARRAGGAGRRAGAPRDPADVRRRAAGCRRWCCRLVRGLPRTQRPACVTPRNGRDHAAEHRHARHRP